MCPMVGRDSDLKFLFLKWPLLALVHPRGVMALTTDFSEFGDNQANDEGPNSCSEGAE